MNLILLDGRCDLAAETATLTGSRAEHMTQVLRVLPGQTVRVGLIDGALGTGTVEAIGRGEVTLRCVFEPAPPPVPCVDLLLAVPRPKVLRRLWAQLAALGVGRIILTNAEKVERPYFDTHVLEEATYRPLLIEGLQQARDTRVPRVSVHRQFRPLVEDRLDSLCGDARRVVADPCGTTTLAAALSTRPARRVLLAVGPEGGWNAFELALLQAHGFAVAGLGRRTLRVDTACIALLSLAHAVLHQE